MWICEKCGRVFEKTNQPHSCKKVPLEQHFKGKAKAKELFDFLVEQVNRKIGKCKIVSIPCCVHLFGTYDFLAALPKKDKLEIRFALDRRLDSTRLKTCVPMSTKIFKNCIDIKLKEEIDEEFIDWVKQSYSLKKGK
ncbi:hypothetical protein C4578_00850 [Candidatus Microgenomates bacterium]|jgi:hypothetical protein|nr:MAG: hypothetical protein C4578_00850 [Candidatus Microgenomates bacterium]